MKRRTFIIIMAAVLLFIWGHSMIPQSRSAEESLGMMIFLQKILDFLHIPIHLTDHIVRKLAHITEYAGAGLLLGLYFLPRVNEDGSIKEKLKSAAVPFGAGLFIGFIDESVQMFSGRGALVSDVWVDFSGISIGVILSVIILLIIRKNR